MTQDLVRTTNPGLLAQIADRLPPMIAAAARGLEVRGLLRRHRP